MLWSISNPSRRDSSGFRGRKDKRKAFHFWAHVFVSASWIHQYKGHPTRTLLWGDSFLQAAIQWPLVKLKIPGKKGCRKTNKISKGSSRRALQHISEPRSGDASSLTYNNMLLLICLRRWTCGCAFRFWATPRWLTIILNLGAVFSVARNLKSVTLLHFLLTHDSRAEDGPWALCSCPTSQTQLLSDNKVKETALKPGSKV